MKEGKIRFNSIFVSNQVIKNPKINELKRWCEEFQKNGLTPIFEGNYTGNLSFRSQGGFVITASGLKSKRNLTTESFVFIRNYDEKTNTFYVKGKKSPSSESIMHHFIYKTVTEINSVFHGHNCHIVKNAQNLGLSITKKEHSPGTVYLAKEVVNLLNGDRMIVLKNHGFVSLGKTMKEAGELTFKFLRKSKEVSNGI